MKSFNLYRKNPAKMLSSELDDCYERNQFSFSNLYDDQKEKMSGLIIAELPPEDRHEKVLDIIKSDPEGQVGDFLADYLTHTSAVKGEALLKKLRELSVTYYQSTIDELLEIRKDSANDDVICRCKDECYC